MLFCRSEGNKIIAIAVQDQGGLDNVAQQFPQRALVGIVKVARILGVQRKTVQQSHVRREFLNGPQGGQLQHVQGVVQVIVPEQFKLLDADG